MAESHDTERMSRPTTTVVVTVLAVAFAAVAFSGVAAANHDGDGNLTVDLPDPEDNEPGNRNASANFFLLNTEQFDTLRSIEAVYPDGVPSRCYNRDTRVFGIDRGNTYSGTRTDESAIPYASDTNRTRHTVYMEFYDSDSTQPSVNLDDGDQFVISVETCIWNPDEPGWYQIHATISGRTPDGDMDSVSTSSHYFYICNCDSEEEARSELGPPPSESTPTATATPTPTPTPTTTPTATVTPTPTPTPEESTPSPTREATTDQSTAEATAGRSTAEPTADGSTTETEQSTVEATAETAATEDSTGETPASADGSGFGPLAGLAALLATALVGLRRLR